MTFDDIWAQLCSKQPSLSDDSAKTQLTAANLRELLRHAFAQGEALAQDKPALDLINAEAAAELLGVCSKHVREMSKEGRMPAGLKLGSRITKWERRAIIEWVQSGCPDMRDAAKK